MVGNNLNPKKLPIALITGANGGIGYAIAKNIITSKLPYFILLACRSKEKATIAQKSLMKDHNYKHIGIILVDIGDCKSVKRCCEEIKEWYLYGRYS